MAVFSAACPNISSEDSLNRHREEVVSDDQEIRPRYTLTEPNLPKPVEMAELTAAKRSACIIFGDVPSGHAVDAYQAVQSVCDKEHTVRCSTWAIWELVEAGGLIVHPRRNIDVVSEEEGTTISYVDDPRLRFNDGRLIPDGPVPLNEHEPIEWRLVRLEPNHSVLDVIARDSCGDPTRQNPAIITVPKVAADIRKIESQTPALDAASDEWLSPAEVKKLDKVDITSLRVLRSVGLKNADNTFGIDKSGRKWRKPQATSNKVYYWIRSLLSQTPKR